MKTKTILAISAYLLAGVSFAGEPMPGAQPTGLNEFPANRHQQQVLGISLHGEPANVGSGESHRGYGTESSLSYNGMSASPHQMDVLKKR